MYNYIKKIFFINVDKNVIHQKKLKIIAVLILDDNLNTLFFI